MYLSEQAQGMCSSREDVVDVPLDRRSIEDLLVTAASLLDGPQINQNGLQNIEEAFANQGVLQVWQLEYLDPADWMSVNVSLGLKTAIRAACNQFVVSAEGRASGHIEEADEARASMNFPRADQNLLDSRETCEHQQCLEYVQKYLRVAKDGEEPKPLRKTQALFCGMLLTSPADCQEKLVRISEIIAIISALGAAIAVSFVGANITTGSTRAAEVQLGWSVSASSVKYCLALMSLLMFCVDAWLCCTTFVLCSAGVFQDTGFFKGCCDLMALAVGLFYGGVTCLFVISIWNTLELTNLGTAAMLASCVCIVFQPALYFGIKTIIDMMPLEMYHLPLWFKIYGVCVCPALLPHFFCNSQLQVRAEKRAACLRRAFQFGGEDSERKRFSILRNIASGATTDLVTVGGLLNSLVDKVYDVQAQQADHRPETSRWPRVASPVDKIPIPTSSGDHLVVSPIAAYGKMSL